MSGLIEFSRRKLLVVASSALLALAACEPVAMDKPGAGKSGDMVKVALLVSSGTGDPVDDATAVSFENAARLAMADLGTTNIDLKVYSAGATAASGSAAATKAAAEGASIILGPLYGEASNAAAVAVAGKNINVLSFSNNATIAGGNLFILGTTYDSIAGRLASYASRQGKKKIVIVHANNAAENIGKDAIARALQASGATLAGTVAFNFSQNDIIASIPQISAKVKSTGADAVFFTSTTDGALPFLAGLLPSNGVSGATTQFIGLQRWDIPANAPATPGLQGGWFAAPDPALAAQFASRYAAAYGQNPHPLAGLAYDGMAAIGALV
ncbi:MAG: ABC transporter substrate-binding protein, partial [Deltaproteobacteria bacterium]